MTVAEAPVPQHWAAPDNRANPQGRRPLKESQGLFYAVLDLGSGIGWVEETPI